MDVDEEEQDDRRDARRLMEADSDDEERGQHGTGPGMVAVALREEAVRELDERLAEEAREVAERLARLSASDGSERVTDTPRDSLVYGVDGCECMELSPEDLQAAAAAAWRRPESPPLYLSPLLEAGVSSLGRHGAIFGDLDAPRSSRSQQRSNPSALRPFYLARDEVASRSQELSWIEDSLPALDPRKTHVHAEDCKLLGIVRGLLVLRFSRLLTRKAPLPPEA